MKKFKMKKNSKSQSNVRPNLTREQLKFLEKICGNTKVPENLMKILRNRVVCLDPIQLTGGIRMGGGSTAWSILLNFTSRSEFLALSKNSSYNELFGKSGIAQLVYSNIAAAIFAETAVTMGLEKASEVLDIVKDFWEINSLEFRSNGDIKIIHKESIALANLIAEALKPENSETPFSWVAATSPWGVKLKRFDELRPS